MADVTELVTVFSFKGSTAPLAQFNERLGSSLAAIAGITAALGGLVSGITAGVGAMANADTKAQQMAKAVGVSVDLVENLGQAVSVSGFGFQDIIELAEEMNNKLGESKGVEEMIAVKESLSILGLEYERLRQLSPEDQFREVTNAALSLEDSQKAVAAADILMGNKSNLLIGTLRQQGGSIDEVTEKFRLLSFRTEESRKGSVAFSDQMKNVSFSGMSALQEFGGILAAELTPMLRSLSDWMTVNRGLIQDGISRIAEGIGVFAEAVVRLMPFLIALTAVFVGLKLATGGFAAALAVLTSPITLIIAGIAAALLIVDDLIVAFQGGNSVIADFFQNFFGVDIRPVLQGIADTFNLMIEGLKISFRALAAVLPDAFRAAVDTISSMFNAMISFFTEKIDFIVGKARAVGEFFGLVDESAEQQQLSPGGGGSSQVNNSVSQDINISVTSDDPATAANLVRDRLNEQLADAQTQFSRGGI